MAQNKKNNTQPKLKKPIKKKAISKKRRVKNKSSKKFIYIVIGIIGMMFAVFIGYYLGMQHTLDATIKPTESKIEQKSKQKTITVSPKKSIKKTKPKILKKKRKNKKEKPKTKKNTYPKKKSIHRNRPKLAIVIDDVSKQSQIRRIRKLNMHITPSIFPPSKLNMSSHRLAKNLKHYMIHLPMESGSKQFNKQYKTLLTSFSQKQMRRRVKELRRLFPHATYINNHTGSVFTSNYKSMYRLYALLRKEGFVFMDSRTSGRSKVKKITRLFKDKYISRDIFIDNIHKVNEIHKQLKKAVRKAKRRGYAVAIGHPHKVTMKALKSAKKILKDVELVYIDRLYKGE